MNTVEVSNVLEISPKLYEMYIKYVCSMHMLTADGTHTHTYGIEGHITIFWYSLFDNMSNAEM